MRKQLLILVLALLPLGLMAQEQEASDTPAKKTRSASGVFTGFSGGMMLHGGYLFADDPTKVFSNTGLGSYEYVKGLPKDGFCYGLGGALRVHLIDHIHIGAEGFVSTMPLMSTGSNVRTGWGGALCDFYTDWGKVRPMIGLTVGGGTMKRLFVPVDSLGYVPVGTTAGDTTNYNASYTKTPFFFIDPYVGLEINLGSHMALLIRIDYMLPFGTTKSKLTENVKWSNFMTPSGPRLYVGVMFGRLKRK
ncbi:MAG: hypothetical protein J5704_01125 [Paludibacteraceae bacterium]|nr:hypothetical protein [Paludibacteraceae bacterium]